MSRVTSSSGKGSLVTGLGENPSTRPKMSEKAQSTENGEEKKKLKPCCACPETKKARDECIIEKGEDSCSKLIEAHKECLRAHGFKV